MGDFIQSAPYISSMNEKYLDINMTYGCDSIKHHYSMVTSRKESLLLFGSNMWKTDIHVYHMGHIAQNHLINRENY